MPLVQTLSLKLGKMRNAQDFVVYPGNVCDDPTKFKIQSDTYIGILDTERKQILLAGPHPNGAYGVHLHMAGPKRKVVDVSDEVVAQIVESQPKKGDHIGSMTSGVIIG